MNKEEREAFVKAYEMINGLHQLCEQLIIVSFDEHDCILNWFSVFVDNYDNQRWIPSLQDLVRFNEQHKVTKEEQAQNSKQ